MSTSNLAYCSLLGAVYAFPLFFTLVHRKMLRRLHYYLILPSGILAAIPFIAWDMLAVARGHWQFNMNNTLEIKLLNLPIEEVLFFFIVPQSTLLIWVALNKYNSPSEFKRGVLRHFKKRP